MIIGIPRETQRLEYRVGLTPFGVAGLARRNQHVVVQAGAGAGAHFADSDYASAGAEVVYNAEEVFKRADVVCQVNMLGPAELDLIKPGLVICGFHHLAVAPRPVFDKLTSTAATLIGYEIIEDENGDRPILLSMSDLAGQMAIHEAAHLLQITSGGRGVLLGNIPGVPAPTVLILGAGTVGTVAAQQAVSMGASVLVMDADVRKLQRVHRTVRGRVDTALVNQAQLARFLKAADVVIGAVLIPGGRAPFVVTEADGQDDEAGQRHRRRVHRPGRLRRDEPAHDARQPDVHGARRRPLLRAEHELEHRRARPRACCRTRPCRTCCEIAEKGLEAALAGRPRPGGGGLRVPGHAGPSGGGDATWALPASRWPRSSSGRDVR